MLSVALAATSILLLARMSKTRSLLKLEVTANTAPLKETPPPAAPRLASAPTDSVPEVTLVPPV